MPKYIKWKKTRLKKLKKGEIDFYKGAQYF